MRIAQSAGQGCLIGTAATNKSQYSLWLVPYGQEHPKLQDLIEKLTLRTEPTTLSFAPHATLLSSEIITAERSVPEIVQCINDALKTFDPALDKVTCKFDIVEAGKLFFQCVYIRLDRHGSTGLLPLHCALRAAFGETKDPDGSSYFPHASLVYGNLDDQQKQQILHFVDEARIVEKDSNDSQTVAGMSHFDATEIQVVRTSGPSDTWQVAARVPLRKQDDEAD